MIKYLVIVQARLGSTRFPAKVMQTVKGVPMVKRVWAAAKQAQSVIGSAHMQVVVAWPERYPDVPETNVLERFRRVSIEYDPIFIIRVTADCPLLEAKHIIEVVKANEEFIGTPTYYMDNKAQYPDGYDVQLFITNLLWNFDADREHVVNPNLISSPCPVGKYSVDTKADLERVRAYAR